MIFPDSVEKDILSIVERINDKEFSDLYYNHIVGRVLTKPFNIQNTSNVVKTKGWNYFYVYVDIHGTILRNDYGNIAKNYYPNAKETLQKLSKRDDIILVLYTCSKKDEIEKYLEFFKSDDIHFKSVNNIEMESNESSGDFTSKPYFNVLLEDKAGFIGDIDWYIVDYYFDKYEKSIS